MRRDDAYLEDIQSACVRVARYIDGVTRADFVYDEKTRAAVEREITIIGEASVKVTDACKAVHDHVPWRKLIRLRNFYMHAYEKLSSDEIWATATRLIPSVGSLISGILDDREKSDES